MAEDLGNTGKGATCPACGAASDEEGILCEHCLAEGRSLPAAPPPQTDGPDPDGPDPDGPDPDGPDPDEQAPDEQAPDEPEAEAPEPDDDGPVLAPDPAPAPERQAEAPPVEPAMPADRPPLNEASDEYFIQKMREVRNSGAPAVVFMGFASAGKTWLVHRFLEQVQIEDDRSRNFTTVSLNEPEGRELEATNYFNFYKVRNEEEPYWLIDTPGEQTRMLMSDREEDFQQAWKIIAALHCAQCVVIAMPADIVLMGPAIEHLAAIRDPNSMEGIRSLLAETGEMTDEEARAASELARELLADHSRIDTFVQGIIDAVAAVSFIRAINVDPLEPQAFRQKVSLAAVQDHRDQKRRFLGWGSGSRGLDCPTFFALTKSDMIISTATDFLPEGRKREVFEERRRDMLARPKIRALQRLVTRSRLNDARHRWLFSLPAELVGAVNPALHKRIVRAFHLARFDYVTAFFGHDATSRRLKYQDYRGCPPLGVEEMRQWIYEARRLHRRWPVRRWQHGLARRLHMALNNINRKKTGI